LFLVVFWHIQKVGSIFADCLYRTRYSSSKQQPFPMNRILLLLLSVISFNLSAKTPAFYPIERPTAILSDTVPPVIQCPASETFFIGVFACDTILNYSVTATDDQGPAIVIQLSGPASGSVFPIGTSTCVFLATDLAGNTATCSFTFTVMEQAINIPICKDILYAVMDANCNYTITPQAALQGGPYGCPSRYLVEVDKTIPFGNGPWLPASFGPNDVGKTYQARVTDTKNNNKCWGNVQILDNTGPTLVCENITVSCKQDNVGPFFLRDSLGIVTGVPTATDACGNVTFLGHTDSTANFNCLQPYTAIVYRRWQANDQNGNTSTCLQTITMHRHTLNELQIPADVTLMCPNDDDSPEVTGQPFVIFQGHRYEMENAALCELTAFYTDAPITIACGNTHIRRIWRRFDFCTGVEDGPFVQNIYLMDETGPILNCPGTFVVTANSDSCRGMVDLPDVVLNDHCSQLISFQAFWMDEGLSKTLMGSLGDFMGNDPLSFDTLGIMGSISLPVGTTVITYVAEDSCGNASDCIFNLLVTNMEPPMARCDSLTTVQLLEDGFLSISAATFDDGSTDDCSPISFKVRFQNIGECLFEAVWNDSLRFCCLNLLDTLDAMLRVYDVPVPPGVVSEDFGEGNFSDCSFKIIVEDPNPPSCIAPANVTVSCADFDPGLESYGAVFNASCLVDSLSVEVDYTNFDTLCVEGNIVRIFKVYDAAGNIGACAQAVTVNYVQEYFVKFPDDVIVSQCSSNGLYGEPVLGNQFCERFQVTYTDELFTVVPDACYKIERTWHITNDCRFDPNQSLITVPNPNPNSINNHPDNLPGPIVSDCNALSPWVSSNVKINPSDPQATNYCVFWSDSANGYKYKQIIKIIDGMVPTGTFVTPSCSNQTWNTQNNPQFWNEMYWNDPTLETHDLCEEPTEISFTGTDNCTDQEVSIDYLLFLDLDYDGIRETVVNSNNLGMNGLGWNNVRYNNLNTPNFLGGTPREFDGRPVPADEKMGFAIETTTSGSTKTARVSWNTQSQPNIHTAPLLPHGSHRIKWFVTDGCGNNKEYEYNFTVRDCRPPNVVCLDSISVNMLPNNNLQINATDLLDYAEDNCTPTDKIILSIRKCGLGTGFPLDGLSNPITNVSFSCSELGDQCVEVWAIDKAGNADFCEATVHITDNTDICTPSNSTGRIITELGQGVGDVGIELKSIPLSPPLGVITTTDTSGYYNISGLFSLPPASRSIFPQRDDNPLNGVTTFDLVLISQHILSISPLNSPYKMIAADANKSGSITSFDIVEFRKLILGIYTEMPNNTSWRFVDSSFVFPNPQNPFQTSFPDTIPITNPIPFNFIAIKVGDINNTVSPNAQSPATERFEGTVYLDSEDRSIQEGEVLELLFRASERLDGCQFSMELDGLEILDILPGADMGREHFAYFPAKSTLTAAWEQGGQASFILKIQAHQSGSLRDMLRLSNHITPTEAYLYAQQPHNAQPGIKQHLALRFGKESSAFELFQNQPNPFAAKTAVTFQLPEASTATLTVFDGNGSVLWSKTADWPAGLNTVAVDLSGMGAAGVLYYKLETPERSAVRKMIRI